MKISRLKCVCGVVCMCVCVRVCVFGCGEMGILGLFFHLSVPFVCVFLLCFFYSHEKNVSLCNDQCLAVWLTWHKNLNITNF